MSSEVDAARQAVDCYEAVMSKVPPMASEAEEMSAALEARLKSLAVGYARLNQLALEAPLGLASAAAAHQARLASFGMSEDRAVVGSWDAEKHRDVLWETREAKRQLDGRKQRKPPRLAQPRVPGAKFASKVFEQPKRQVVKVDEELTIPAYRERPAHVEPPRPRAKKKPVPVRVIIKDQQNTEALKAATEAARAAAAAAKRAAAAADRAAAAPPVAAPREAPAVYDCVDHVVIDNPVPDYRILPVSGAAPYSTPFAPPPPPPPEPASARPRTKRHADLYLAAPRDADEQDAPLRQLPSRFVDDDPPPPAHSADPLIWIPQGAAMPPAPPPDRPPSPVAVPPRTSDATLAPPIGDLRQNEDACLRLVTRLMLDRVHQQGGGPTGGD